MAFNSGFKGLMYEMDYWIPPKQQTIRYESDRYILWFVYIKISPEYKTTTKLNLINIYYTK